MTTIEQSIKQSIERKIGRLSPDLSNRLDSLMADINFRLFDKYDRYTVVSVLADLLIKKISDVDYDRINIDEYNAKILLSGKQVTKEDIISSDVVLPYNKIHSNIVKVYVCLDSRYRRSDVSDFSWYYSNSRELQNGVVTSTIPAKNILAMKLYQPVIPLDSINNLYTSMPKISVLVEELSSFSFIANRTRRYHWLCRVYPTEATTKPDTTAAGINHYELDIFDFNKGLFRFPMPVNLYNSITLTFGDPTDKITFKNDRDTGRVTTYGASTIITMDSAHDLPVDCIVYITGFTTNTPSYDNNNINSVTGIRISAVAGNTFTIPVDTSSGAVSWIVNQPVSVFYGARRMVTGLELICLREKNEDDGNGDDGNGDDGNQGLSNTQTNDQNESNNEDQTNNKSRQEKNYKSIYAYFDTDDLQITDDLLLKSWPLVYSREISPGCVNIPVKPQMIHGIKLLPIRIPINDLSYTGDDITRWGLLIDEFKGDAMRNYDQLFHFMFTGYRNLSYDSTKYIETINDDFNAGYYWFVSGIKPPDSITFTFSSLMNKIRIPTQYAKYRVIQSSNPLRLTPYEVIPPYTLTTEDIVISGFYTGNNVADSVLIANVNKTNTITALIGSDIVIGAINASTMTTIGSDIVVLVKSKNNFRMIFGLEMLYSTDE